MPRFLPHSDVSAVTCLGIDFAFIVYELHASWSGAPQTRPKSTFKVILFCSSWALLQSRENSFRALRAHDLNILLSSTYSLVVLDRDLAGSGCRKGEDLKLGFQFQEASEMGNETGQWMCHCKNTVASPLSYDFPPWSIMRAYLCIPAAGPFTILCKQIGKAPVSNFHNINEFYSKRRAYAGNS